MVVNILFILLAVCAIALIYCSYQLRRNDEVFRIRMRWIELRDDRRSRFSYDFMMSPSKYNLYGLRWPDEIHYK